MRVKTTVLSFGEKVELELDVEVEPADVDSAEVYHLRKVYRDGEDITKQLEPEENGVLEELLDDVVGYELDRLEGLV